MGESTTVIPSRIDASATDGEYITADASNKLTLGNEYFKQQGETEIEIIELQANAGVTPLDHDTLISDTFSDSTGYENSVNLGNTDATFDTNKYKSVSSNFTDTFNRADSATVGNGWAEIETAGSASIDTNRLKIIDTTTTGGLKTDVRHLSATGTFDEVVVVMECAQTTGIVSYSIQNSSDLELIRISFKEDGNITYLDSTTTEQVIQSYLADTSYSINLKNIDFSAGTVDIYIDDVLKVSGASIWNTGTPNKHAFFTNTISVGTFYVDEIQEINNSISSEKFVEIDLPTISGTVAYSELIVNDVDRETGDDITYDLVDASANEDTSRSIEIKNAIANLVSNPTKLKINLVPKETSPTDGFPSVKTYCLKLWKV